MVNKKRKKGMLGKGRTNNNFLKKNYSQSWSFVKESKNFVYVAIGIFLLFVAVGFFVPPPADIEQKILEFVQELFLKTEGMSQGELINFIFFNNLQASFFGMILGIALGVYPLASTILNGYIVGYVSSLSVGAAGFSTLLNLVPHGIFELPALFISLGLGLLLGYHSILFLYEFIRYHQREVPLWLLIILLILLPILFLIISFIIDRNNKKFSEDMVTSIINSLRVFAFIVLPLLIVAAIIEGSLIFFSR
ncbi:MAG: stage II sporulation protein M [Candidatus Pacearchaeota archaeon]